MKSRAGSSIGGKLDGLRMSGAISPLPSIYYHTVQRQDRYHYLPLYIVIIND